MYTKFANDQHRQFYEDHAGRGSDYNALVYLVGISSTLRSNFTALYDIKNRCIKPEALRKPWQTSSNMALTRLAFSVYCGHPVIPEDLTGHDIMDELERYSVPEIFSRLNEWAPFALYCLQGKYCL